MNENQKNNFIKNVLTSALKEDTLKELFESKTGFPSQRIFSK